MRAPFIPVVLACALLAGCGNLLDPAAAVANGHKITTDEVSEEVERFRATSRFAQLASQGDEGAIERDIEQSHLSLLIRRQVYLGEAEERDITVTEKEVTDYIEKLKEEEFDSEGDFQEALKEEGLDLEQLRLRVEVDLLEKELRDSVTADVVPDEAALRAYYADNIEDYQQVRVQHILVGNAGLADRLATRLRKAPDGKVDKLFEDLAARHSEDPSSANAGGDLGWSTPGEYVAAFADAIAALEVGEISEPVRTEFGVHVIRVKGRRVEAFEQARSEIVEEVGGDKADAVWARWLKSAYEEADVRVNSRYGELDVETHVVTDPDAEDVPAAEVPSPAEAATPLP